MPGAPNENVIGGVNVARQRTAVCGYGPIKAQSSDATMPSVVATEVISLDVTRSFDHVGRVEAIDRVSLRARVQGVLAQRLFREGATVEQ